MGVLAAMMEERYTRGQMAQLCPVEAKTELVLLSNPATGDEAMYKRDGDGWVRLQGYGDEDSGAAPERPSPGAAPLSWRIGPERGLRRGDDVPALPEGPVSSLPAPTAESNP